MKNLRKQAVYLRRRGWSYKIISERLGLSKSTLSDWLREIKYTPNQTVIARIKAGPAKAAVIKQKRRSKEIAILKKEGFRTIGKIFRRDLLLLGIGIYMGEGSKLYEITRVINSDPRIIKLAIVWFKNICGVSTQNFAIAVHLYPDTPQKEALAYWSRKTGIPKRQFEKVQIDRRLGKSIKKQGHLPYGTAHLTIRSRGDTRFGVTLHRRIIGWIEAVYKNLRV